MKISIRAHDLGCKGLDGILSAIDLYGIDGVQLVCYKSFDDVSYVPGGITAEKAAEIGRRFADAGKLIPLVGAYFNPVHSNPAKVENGFAVFSEYLKLAGSMGCKYVGSETGSFNDDKWTYHPRNRTPEAFRTVVETFDKLCEVAEDAGSMVAMEGAAGHVMFDVDTLQRARKAMSGKTRVIFDLYNYLDEGNQGDYLSILDKGLETFAGDILLFHLKDCCFVNGEKPRQVPFGTGEMDLDAILGKIKAYDRNAVLTLEGTTGEHIAKAVNTINTIWERV